MQHGFNEDSIRLIQQKQTLNEVENLYFHHYRARISPKVTVKTEKGLASISSQGTSEPPAIAANSTFPATTAPTVDACCTDQPQDHPPTDAGESTAPTVAGEENSAMDVDPPPDQDGSNVTQNEQVPSDAQPTQSHPPIPASPTVTPPSPHPRMDAKTPSPSKPSQPPLMPSPVHHTRQYSVHTSASHSHSTKPSANVPAPLSRNLPLTQLPSHPQSPALLSVGPTPAIRLSNSASLISMPGGSSNVALTYDSFWSSHSTTSTNYRSTMTSLNKGDASTALPNLETSYALSMGAPNPSFEPLPLQKQRSLARKPAVTALRQTYSRSTGDG